jgi:hypothetical protein
MKCEWFAMCDRNAVGVTSHPVLEYVPICARCAENFDLEVTPVDLRPSLAGYVLEGVRDWARRRREENTP